MYNYDFENEKVLLEIVDSLATINDSDLKVNILITEENLLLFRNIKSGNIFTSRGIYEAPEYELIIKIKLDNVKYKIDEGNTILEVDNKEIILYNFDLSKVNL